MKKRSFYISLITILAAVTLSIGAFAITRLMVQTRWDKVPVVGAFVLGIRQDIAIDASLCPKTITWDMLDEEPENWPSNQGWFNYINRYTRRLLKNYMKEKHLAIARQYYIVETTNTIEELLEILKFVPLDHTM